MPRPDQRSPEAQEYRGLYDLQLWRHPTRGLRARQLARQPLCERHLARGEVVPADTVNHRVPHRGDRTLFADEGNLESVCGTCHASVIQREERGRPIREVGADGWPVE